MPLSLTTDQAITDRRLLALDALSALSSQFSRDPDFGRLISAFILTISGQCAAADCFIVVHQPGDTGDATLSFATGRFTNLETARYLREFALKGGTLHKEQGLIAVNDLAAYETLTDVYVEIESRGVSIVAPLLCDEQLIGLIGIGKRVDGRQYNADDIALLRTSLNTISPLIANAYLFLEIVNLNKWYLQIIDHIKQGVFVLDASGIVRKVNRRGTDIMAALAPNMVNSGTLIGLSLECLFPEKLFPNWRQKILEAGNIPGGKILESMIAKGPLQDKIFNVRIGKIEHELSSHAETVISLDDITKSKASEQRLFELEKLAEKGAMASSISHELNNFLAMILGGVEITEIMIKKGEHGRAGNALDRLKNNIMQMERFTTGLMDYARLETRKQSTDLNHLISDILSFITVQKRFAKIDTVIQLAPDLPQIEIDSDQIAQLIINTLNNAADAIAETGRPAGRIVITTGRESDHILLTITDNGCGMTPDVKDRLFKQRLTTKEKGHGYGLMTCGKIIANHGAAFDIDSTVGSGTTFCFRIPMA
jgi:signal transduction histidine kinase